MKGCGRKLNLRGNTANLASMAWNFLRRNKKRRLLLEVGGRQEGDGAGSWHGKCS